MKISDFQAKDVINIVDGKKLGQISDMELNLHHGRIEAIVVPNASRFLGLFGSTGDIIIPWDSIIKIGMDVVLVRLEDARPYRYGEDLEGAQDSIRPYRG